MGNGGSYVPEVFIVFAIKPWYLVINTKSSMAVVVYHLIPGIHELKLRTFVLLFKARTSLLFEISVNE